MTALALALLSGVLSTLSPCVLPLLPIVLGAALGQHRYGPAALAIGVAFSFVAVGLFIATIGFALGVDQSLFRNVAAGLLIIIGAVLLVPRWQEQVALASGSFGNWAHTKADGLTSRGLAGQFAIGFLLGAVWSPCVGPTLGAASVLAAQGKDLGHVAITMLTFGLGAAAPLLLLSLLSREAMMRWRGRLLATSRGGKYALGVLLMLVGLLIVSGLDKRLETVLVDASPAWLTNLTTRF